MVLTYTDFDIGQLTFAPKVATSRAGGKYVSVAYHLQQVEFQLGTSPRDTMRTPFGAELAARDDPTSAMVVKIELDGSKQRFIERIEAATTTAAQLNSQEWFGRSNPSAVHNSLLKEQNGDRPPVLKLKIATGPRATVISVASLTNGKLSRPVLGTVEDIKPGVFLLPVIRIQGGVYFINRTYGTSLVATAILVVKNLDCVETNKEPLEFNLGDVEMVDDELSDEDL